MARDQKEILEDMLRWLRFTGIQQAKDVVDEVLTFEDDERKQRDARVAYELTDGNHSQAEISRRITYSRPTVGNWQEKWGKLGIADEDPESGNYAHLISLEELGLDRPPVPDEGDSTEAPEEDEDLVEE